MNKRFKKTLKTIFVFTLIFSWIFSGWPNVLDFYFNGERLKLPSEIQKAQAATERKSPDGLLQQDNLSGAVTDIDEDPDAPDANWLTYITAGTDTVARVSFPTPTSNLTVGAGLQEFKIWVRRAFVGSAKTPTVRIELYENGVSKATVLSNTNVTNDTGVLLSGTWDATLLGTADGSLVECYIYGTADTAGQNKSMIEIGAVEWNVDYNTSPTLSISQPDGISDTVTAGDSYNITYTLADADDTVTAAFSYDSDNTGLNGTAITGACATAAEGSGATCSWDTTDMTPGNYYVYGITNDGTNPQVSAYSPGQITIEAAEFSTAIEIRAQNYSTLVSTITFPEGDTGATVSNPSNSESEMQVFGGAGDAKPVVTLYNGNASALIIWYNITTFAPYNVVSNEYYLINDSGAACADDTVIANAVTFDADTVSAGSTTIDTTATKDLYLKINLSAVAGKTGDSTLTILGETP